MIDITIKVQGFDQVLEYMAQIKRRTPIAGDNTAKEVCKRMAKIARDKVAPGKSGSGALKQSINYRRVAGSKQSASKTWTVDTSGKGTMKGSPIPDDQRPQHAYYQEYGFAKHSVRVSNLSPGTLKEKMEGLGKEVITVSESTPYMSYARRKVLNKIRTISNIYIGIALRTGGMGGVTR